MDLIKFEIISVILKWIRTSTQCKLNLESLVDHKLDPFRNRTIVRVWCIAPAGLLKITEPEMPLHISLNMQNDVLR